MRREDKPTGTWESRFRSARNAALAIGGIAMMTLTEKSTHAGLATAAVSFGAASNLELWRFSATPDSERKRRIMRTFGKCASVISFYVAATYPIEAVTLLANDTKPVTTGLVGVHNLYAQDDTWLPDNKVEIGAYAAADAAAAVFMGAVGVSAWRRKEQPPLRTDQIPETAG